MFSPAEICIGVVNRHTLLELLKRYGEDTRTRQLPAGTLDVPIPDATGKDKCDLDRRRVTVPVSGTCFRSPGLPTANMSTLTVPLGVPLGAALTEDVPHPTSMSDATTRPAMQLCSRRNGPSEMADNRVSMPHMSMVT